jgi:hypothetical protein
MIIVFFNGIASFSFENVWIHELKNYFILSYDLHYVYCFFHGIAPFSFGKCMDS